MSSKIRKANVLDYLYNGWCILWLVCIFLVLFPFMYTCMQYKGLHKYGTKLTNYWADAFFFISFMWVKIEYQFKPNKKNHYVFVANHFSLLDAAVGMKVVRNYFSYMGKSSVKSIPLLGYLFSKLHIEVNRNDKNSRTKSFIRSVNALKNGRSLFIMPEGGILSKSIPTMLWPFKDGAFALAIDTKTPIVPISFLNSWQIMPNSFIFWDFPRVVIHQPIETKHKTMADMEDLKKEVYNIIQTEVDRYGNRN